MTINLIKKRTHKYENSKGTRTSCWFFSKPCASVQVVNYFKKKYEKIIDLGKTC